MRKSVLAALALAAAVGLATGAALAHKGATGIVKERMDAMKAVADATKTIAQMIKGETVLDNTAAAEAASIIEGHARKMPELFPQDSTDHPSEALPAIWQDWDQFTEIAERLAEGSAELAATAAAAGDASELRAPFGPVAATCGACHEKFRLPQ